MCNPLHNRSRSPAVNRKPSISVGYQRSGRSRRTGSGVKLDFPILLHEANVASRFVSLSQVPQSSIIRSPVGSSVIIDPILLSVGHALSTRNFPCGPGPVKGAAFRAIAERFKPVLFLGRIPLVDDHFHRHPAAPDTGRAFRVVGPGVQTTRPTAAIGFQVRRHSKERRPGMSFTRGISDDLEPARLVECRGLLPLVFDRHGAAPQFNACLKPVFLVRGFADRDQELAGLPTASSIDAKNVPQVAVGPLIERPREPNAGLDGRDTA